MPAAARGRREIDASATPNRRERIERELNLGKDADHLISISEGLTPPVQWRPAAPTD